MRISYQQAMMMFRSNARISDRANHPRLYEQENLTAERNPGSLQ
jgi:hypothetical protein